MTENTDSCRPSKRARSSSIASDVPTKPTPCDSLWFEDGNVVLATTLHLYRVHKGVLSRQSSVFRDIFKIPLSNEAGGCAEEYEGVPLVKLVGDDDEDVSHLLRTLYDRLYYCSDNNNTELPVIRALLRLGNKYDFCDIKADVLKQLGRLLPSTLEGIDGLKTNNDILFGEYRLESYLTLINICHDSDADHLLPTLYYLSSEFDMDDIFESSPKCLDSDQAQNLIMGKFALVEAVRSIVFGFLDDEPYSTCQGDQKDLCHTMNNYYYAQDRTKLAVTLLHLLKGEKVIKSWKGGICESCRRTFIKRINAGRKQVWDRMPEYFGLQGSDESDDTAA